MCSSWREEFKTILSPADGWIVVLDVSSWFPVFGRKGTHSTRWTMVDDLIYCLYSYYHSHFYMACRLNIGMAVKMWWLTFTGWLPLPICFVVTSDEYLCTHKYSRSIFPLCVHSVKSIYISLAQTFLSLILNSCSKTLAT